MENFDIWRIMKNSSKRLNHIRRYSSVQVIRQENVSEHMYWVALYSMEIAEYLQQNWYSINWERLMKYSVLHDLPESQTGDILRITKYHNPQIKELIDQAEKDLFSKSLDGVPYSVQNNFKDFAFNAKDHTLEGRIIALCDLLSVFSYCIEEYIIWNENMRVIYKEARGYITNFDSGGYELLSQIANNIPLMLTKEDQLIEKL